MKKSDRLWRALVWGTAGPMLYLILGLALDRTPFAGKLWHFDIIFCLILYTQAAVRAYQLLTKKYGEPRKGDDDIDFGAA